MAEGDRGGASPLGEAVEGLRARLEELKRRLAEEGQSGASPPAERPAPVPLLLKGLLEAAVGAYTLFLLLARELIDAQLRALGGARAASEVRRERVEVE